jgi:hypothetical protein
LVVKNFIENLASAHRQQRQQKPLRAEPFLPTSYYQNNAAAQHYACHLTFPPPSSRPQN